jgi:hypothetical protein
MLRQRQVVVREAAARFHSRIPSRKPNTSKGRAADALARPIQADHLLPFRAFSRRKALGEFRSRTYEHSLSLWCCHRSKTSRQARLAARSRPKTRIADDCRRPRSAEELADEPFECLAGRRETSANRTSFPPKFKPMREVACLGARISPTACHGQRSGLRETRGATGLQSTG